MELLETDNNKLSPRSFSLKEYLIACKTTPARVVAFINRQLISNEGSRRPIDSHSSTTVDTNRGELNGSAPADNLNPGGTIGQNRYSVVYQFNEQYHQAGCTTYSHAQAFLNLLLTDPQRVPVGIYDDKTELFEWEPSRQHEMNQLSIGEQGKQGEAIIALTQTLRRLETSRQTDGFDNPGIFE